jgi:hypothetical protein
MELLKPFVLVATLAAVAALIFGVSAMSSHGEVGHQSSVQWMTWRVGLQAIAFLLVLLALFGLN